MIITTEKIEAGVVVDDAVLALTVESKEIIAEAEKEVEVEAEAETITEEIKDRKGNMIEESQNR
jgi:hypothetical protein